PPNFAAHVYDAAGCGVAAVSPLTGRRSLKTRQAFIFVGCNSFSLFSCLSARIWEISRRAGAWTPLSLSLGGLKGVHERRITCSNLKRSVKSFHRFKSQCEPRN